METVRQALGSGLSGLVAPRVAQSILATLPAQAEVRVGTLDVVATQSLLRQVEQGLRLFGAAPTPQALRELRWRCTGGKPPPAATARIPVRSDADVLTVQSRCQALCKDFFGATDCIRLATAASELARNIYMYAREGEVTLEISEDDKGTRLTVLAVDQGPGIPDPALVLSGQYRSRTGLGRGLVGTQALLDSLEIDSAPGRGTTVRGMKRVRRA